MTDTPESVRRMHREMLMRRSGEERLRMGSSMFETAMGLVRASLGDREGNADSGEFRARLFLRVYGRDFDEQTALRIAEYLRGPPPTS